MPTKPRPSPAARVIKMFGGASLLATDMGITPMAVYHWERRGGRIPSKYHRPLLDLAAKRGKRLRASELIA